MPDLSQFWPVVVAFAALVAAGIGLPMPEEFPTIGAGIWVASSNPFPSSPAYPFGEFRPLAF